MFLSILNVCKPEEDDEDDEDDGLTNAQRREIIRNKILATGKLLAMFRTLRYASRGIHDIL